MHPPAGVDLDVAALVRADTGALDVAREPDADARAKAVVDFETGIAQASWTRTESRDADKTYNKMSVADLAKSAPGFDFAAYLAANKTPVDSVIVAQPSAITGIAKLVGEAPIQVLQDQLLIRSLDGFADVLPKAFDDENFAFYGTTLSGTPQQEERWKRAVDFTTGALDDEVSKIYVAKYFPPATKAAADQLVKNIIAAMNARIDKLTWMSPATKVRAHAKLASFRFDALHLAGRQRAATELFERLLELRNDVGLLSEEWDPVAGRQLGNTPQAFSHFPLVTSGLQLHAGRPHRSDETIRASRGA